MALIGAVVWEAGASTSINEGAIWNFDELSEMVCCKDCLLDYRRRITRLYFYILPLRSVVSELLVRGRRFFLHRGTSQRRQAGISNRLW
jgi:hypothetical protein